MYTYNDPTSTEDGYFTDGDPLGDPPIPRTVLRDIWPNMIQRELINLVEGAGIELDESDFTQILQAVNSIVGESAQQITDSLEELIVNTAAISAPTGSVTDYAGSTPPSGWLARNGQTIGSVSSGANHAEDQYQALYVLLWNNFSNTDCPVTGGRGGSASADWSANKPMALMDDRGLVVRGFDGTGSVDPDRGSGDFGTVQQDQNGEHSHTGTTDNDGQHSHTVDTGFNETGGTRFRSVDNVEATLSTDTDGEHQHQFTTDTTGGSETRMKNRAYLPIIKI